MILLRIQKMRTEKVSVGFGNRDVLAARHTQNNSGGVWGMEVRFERAERQKGLQHKDI